MHIGLIGLGLVGSALAERLIAAGHMVYGYDLSESCRQNLSQLGGRAANSVRETLAAADICLLSLPNSVVSKSVLDDVLLELRGKTVIDTTTGEPDEMAQMASRVSAAGGNYLDATIVGSSKLVRAGEVQVLVGGNEATLVACRSIFECFAREIFYLGPAGSGARMKLVVNLVLGLNRAVLAEGLTFAQACGVDPARALQVLQAGLAYSRIMDVKGKKMLQWDFAVEARLSQHHKDVRLMLDAAQRAGMELPLSRVHDELLAKAESLGYGDADNSAVIAAYGSKPASD